MQRRLSLAQAASLNMAMMVGVGPFLTIPGVVDRVGARLALIVWAVGAVVAMADGLVWSELAAAFPGSGGTYHYYDAVYGESPVGRLLKFLFVWQFLFSAPLEVASGAVGFARYAAHFLPEGAKVQVVAMIAMIAVVALAYRRIEVAGRLMVVLCAGMVVTMIWITASGFARFDPALSFAATSRSGPVDVRAVGGSLGLAMYCYLGYYQVCYLGDEVDDPPRTVPRSILISVAAIGGAYLALNLAILGAMPAGEVATSQHIATDVIGRLQGPRAASIITGLILWTALAGTYAAVLGYSRVPYAAARAGHFFRSLGAIHPTGGFPHRSLLLVGGLSTLACLVDLETVIAALLTSRIVIQFLGQVATVIYLRSRPEIAAKLRFRMAFYPLPALVALAGWLCVFAASDPTIIAYGLGSMAAGILAFAVWDRGRTGEQHTGIPKD